MLLRLIFQKPQDSPAIQYCVQETYKTYEILHRGETFQCNEAFTDFGHLTRHKITHTREKPFKCNKCNKAFTDSGHLTRHKITHTMYYKRETFQV